jgi:hypothetical protein
MNLIAKAQAKAPGKLIVKEYPTASANVNHFRHLLNELELKKKFVPDIIYIDYLNICSSSRVKMSNTVNSYILVKSIAEEIRGLAVEFNLPIVSATQLTRGGSGSSDVSMTDTSECIWVEESIRLVTGVEKKIKDVEVGDQITSNDEYKTVMTVHHTKPKMCVKVTLKSGKTIVVSKDHVFPTSRGRLSINTGLNIGDKLHSN